MRLAATLHCDYLYLMRLPVAELIDTARDAAQTMSKGGGLWQ